MSSSSPFLVFLLRDPEVLASRHVRLRHADNYVSRLMPAGYERTVAGDATGGMVKWSPAGETLDWDFSAVTDDDAIAWIHVPGVGARSDQNISERDLAIALLEGHVEPWSLSPPYSVARWRPGRVDVVNDLLGAARIYHYSFPSGEVWTTRMGLAHLFMGEMPTKNRVAWAGMAAIGWAPAGTTQIGDGKQLDAGTRVVASRRHNRIRVETDDYFAPWFRYVRGKPTPSASTQVEEMTTVMATASRWPERVVADLSGGKDSRLIVALGLRAGLIQRVRTIASEQGEVDTARVLVARSPGLQHDVVDSPGVKHRPPSGVDRLTSRHVAWEGRFLAASGYSDTSFAGFGTSRRPNFNGLGGEIIAGGALAPGAWRGRLEHAPPSEASRRHASWVQQSRASDEAQGLTAAALDSWIPRAKALGVMTAFGVTDIVYMLDRVPHWTNTFVTPNIVCPLLAPSVLAQGACAVGRPNDAGPPHPGLIARAYPAWSDVPFYKASGATVLRPRIWETAAWSWVRATVMDKVEATRSFSPPAMHDALRAIDAGTAAQMVEVAIQRVLWEISFDPYLADLSREVEAMRRDLAAVRRSPLDRLLRVAGAWRVSR